MGRLVGSPEVIVAMVTSPPSNGDFNPGNHDFNLGNSETILGNL